MEEEASEIECTTASCKLVRVMINGRQQRDMGCEHSSTDHGWLESGNEL